MFRPRKTIAAMALGALMAGPGAAMAQEKAPDELAREGMSKIISALELLISTIPTYELPEVLPNGDIIIRRRNPETPEEEPGKQGDEGDDPKPI